MAKKLLGGLGIGGKKKKAAAETVTPESNGPIVKSLSGDAPAGLGDPRKRRGGRLAVPLTILSGTLGG